MRFSAYLAIFLLLSYSPLTVSLSIKDISLKNLCDQWGFSDDQCCMADKTIKFLGYGGLVTIVSAYGVPFALAQLGFTATGITGGSLAALWQSTGMAPRVFAILQSYSMTGAATGFMTKVGISIVALKNYFGSCGAKPSSDGENCKKNSKC